MMSRFETRGRGSGMKTGELGWVLRVDGGSVRFSGGAKVMG